PEKPATEAIRSHLGAAAQGGKVQPATQGDAVKNPVASIPFPTEDLERRKSERTHAGVERFVLLCARMRRLPFPCSESRASRLNSYFQDFAEVTHDPVRPSSPRLSGPVFGGGHTCGYAKTHRPAATRHNHLDERIVAYDAHPAHRNSEFFRDQLQRMQRRLAGEDQRSPGYLSHRGNYGV